MSISQKIINKFRYIIMRIEVPTDLSQITIGQFLKWKHASENSSEEFLPFLLISIFCNIELNEVIKIPKKQFDEIIFTIGQALEQEPKHELRFTMNGVEYGFLPNIDEIKTGEYIDLDTYINTEPLKAMMVMYRPIKGKFKVPKILRRFCKENVLYNIEDYKGTEGFEIMNDAPASIFLGAKVFFYNLSNELLKCLPNYLDRVTTTEEKTIMEKNGVGISQLMQSLKEITSNTSKYMNYQYSNS